MFNNKPVFAELFGLVIFDLKNLRDFQMKYALGQDLLEILTTTNFGTQVSEEGAAIPISGITGDYYYIAATDASVNNRYLSEEQIRIRSKGWVLESESGEIMVCGIGYLKRFDENFFMTTDKFPRLSITKGWNEIEIVGGIDADGRAVYEILARAVSSKPYFSANFEDVVNFVPE